MSPPAGTIWNVDTRTRFNVRKGFFGAAGSPLVEDGRVIANIGGTDGDKGAGIVAFNAETGAVMWTATNHEASYSSPVGATFGGKRTAVFFTRNGLVGLDPSSGSIFFQRMWRSRSASSVNAATPLVIGDVDLHLRDLRDRRRRGPRAGQRAQGCSGRRTRCCRITTRRACTTTATCTDSTDGRNSIPASARWS